MGGFEASFEKGTRHFFFERYVRSVSVILARGGGVHEVVRGYWKRDWDRSKGQMERLKSAKYRRRDFFRVKDGRLIWD